MVSTAFLDVLSTLCIVCTTSYLYRYRPSSSYAEIPKKKLIIIIFIYLINTVHP